MIRRLVTIISDDIEFRNNFNSFLLSYEAVCAIIPFFEPTDDTEIIISIMFLKFDKTAMPVVPRNTATTFCVSNPTISLIDVVIPL